MSNDMSLFYGNAITYPYQYPCKIGAMLSNFVQEFYCIFQVYALEEVIVISSDIFSRTEQVRVNDIYCAHKINCR